MREKLIELVLDYCVRNEEDWDIPYKADELRKYTNEYLLELIEKQLDCYMNVVHGTRWREKVGVHLVPPSTLDQLNKEITKQVYKIKYADENDFFYGYGDVDPLFPDIGAPDNVAGYEAEDMIVGGLDDFSTSPNKFT